MHAEFNRDFLNFFGAMGGIDCTVFSLFEHCSDDLHLNF